MAWICATAAWDTVAIAHASGLSPIRRVTDMAPSVLTARSRSDRSDPQSHTGGSPASRTYRHAGHSQAGGAGGRGSRGAQQAQGRDRQTRRSTQRFEKRDVDLPDAQTVQAHAHDQNTEQLRAGTGNRHDGVRAGLDDPRPVVRPQQPEVRRLAARMDA